MYLDSLKAAAMDMKSSFDKLRDDLAEFGPSCFFDQSKDARF